MADKILFSAVIVTYNDSNRLKECLESLFFCDQLVVVDLNSTDSSVSIAKYCGAEVYTHERVPVVEMIREFAFTYARNSWVIHIDPDEVFPKERLPELSQLVTSPEVAIIRLPWRFYFKCKPLSGTVWGGENSKPCVFHKKKIVMFEKVHVSPKPTADFREIRLTDSRKGAIKHYWVDSYRQMLEKHLRYIKREGEAKYAAGGRFTWRTWSDQTALAFKDSLITHRGWSDGITGVFLSTFYAWYVAMSYLSLRDYQINLKNKET